MTDRQNAKHIGMQLVGALVCYGPQTCRHLQEASGLSEAHFHLGWRWATATTRTLIAERCLNKRSRAEWMHWGYRATNAGRLALAEPDWADIRNQFEIALPIELENEKADGRGEFSGRPPVIAPCPQLNLSQGPPSLKLLAMELTDLRSSWRAHCEKAEAMRARTESACAIAARLGIRIPTR